MQLKIAETVSVLCSSKNWMMAHSTDLMMIEDLQQMTPNSQMRYVNSFPQPVKNYNYLPCYNYSQPGLNSKQVPEFITIEAIENCGDCDCTLAASSESKHTESLLSSGWDGRYSDHSYSDILATVTKSLGPKWPFL